MESVVDSLSNRATSTLHCRAGPLLKFAKFWRDRGLNFSPFKRSWCTSISSLRTPGPLQHHDLC